MSELPQPPLEESPEVAAAVDDDTTVSAFITGGGPDEDSPEFQEPGGAPESTPAVNPDVP
ncbi:hypothetical protein [Spirilliplanes yamanashiensis]|uniref:Uncharacterized protein n=1 Tax=Spirilliplanes yamanashiensis TaxID=42233 RepID=A0A8J3Y4D0_9ACTN|nr:hypothetical protein [Spirilliplanes yamanashiensis]MDP9820017.1 hypothetical protein [Spirilliplanes yamanashiensis]GIJ01163.1 hypothetical protein Sya03_05150 [Spirilliplanes yamanashiensis]